MLWGQSPLAWLEGQERDLRRAAEADREAAGADARGHEEVAAALDPVAAGVAVAETRRDDPRAQRRRCRDLAAVRMARDRERDALGDPREDVGAVGQDDQ